ncbi:MAG: HEAT repeat domain-containing protein [Sphingosinicella sp.]|nr:HEAT repeat domain-containing protein [Sphingosinicella sp.]
MLDFLWGATLVFVAAAVGMWLWAIVRRALMAKAPVRQAPRKAAGLLWILWCQARDGAKLDAKLAEFDPRTLLETAAYALPLLTGADRESTISALGRAGLDSDAERYMRRAPEGQRLLCCEILGAMKSRRSLRVLRRALKDRAPSVRVAAAISLAQRQELPPLQTVFRQMGPDARGSSRLAQLFEELLPDRQQEVIEVARNPLSEPQVRISALQALVLKSDFSFIPFAESDLDGAPPAVAAAAARLIGGYADPRAIQILVKLLKNDSAVVRRAAVEAAGEIADPKLEVPLEERLADEDDLVRYSVVRALQQVLGPNKLDPDRATSPTRHESSPLEAA